MKKFLANLALLGLLAGMVYIILPDLVSQIIAIYNGLGLLFIMGIFVILAALPRPSRRRR
jgi:hypothetical protein